MSASVNTRNANAIRRWDFEGATLPVEWSIISQGTGQSVTVAASEVSLVAGTTALAETIIRCSKTFSLKARARWVVRLSQRIANNTFALEITNAAGTTVAGWVLDGTSATSAKAQSQNQGTALAPLTVTVPSTATYDIFEITADAESLLFGVKDTGLSTGKASTMIERLILDPEEAYYLQVRCTNGAVAPASSTTLFLDAVTLWDLETLMVQVAGGTGDGVGGVAVPVRPVGGALDTMTTLTTVTTVGAVTRANTVPIGLRATDTTAVLAGGATFTGAAKDCAAVATYTRLRTFVNASHTGTLFVEHSSDSTNWFIGSTTAVAAATPAIITDDLVMRYVRVRYVNGATLQTSFKIDTLLFS